MNRTHYDFSYLQASSSETLDLMPALQVPFVISAVLVCRVHVTELGSNASFDIDCGVPAQCLFENGLSAAERILGGA